MTKIYVCDECGSEDIAFSGFLKWDSYNQCLVPDGLDTPDEDPADRYQYASCGACGNAGSGVAECVHYLIKDKEAEDAS